MVLRLRTNPTRLDERTFRRRFRLPFAVFDAEVEAARAEHPEWESNDAAGRPGVPLEIKILGALRHLGRGGVWDTVSECSGNGGCPADQMGQQINLKVVTSVT